MGSSPRGDAAMDDAAGLRRLGGGGLHIRVAGPQDVDVVAPLFDAYRQFYRQSADLERAAGFLMARIRAGESVVLMAEQAGAAVGFTQLYPSFSSVRTGRTFVLNDLFVASDARGGGVAKALLAAAAELAAERGAIGLNLSTGVENRAAQRLYERCGWTRDEGFLTYELVLSPASAPGG
jgi:GNAT superfamily N-acetyltransferase